MQEILNLVIILSLLFLTTNSHFQYTDGLGGNETDYQALLAIKAEITFDHSSSILSSWNDSLHFCDWEGITCGRRHRRVVALDLHSSNIAGTLSPFIGNLSFLRFMYLSDNSFRGFIPHQISHLRRLQKLHLHINSFEGEIPANLSCCSRLTTLAFRFNKLVGSIPDDIGRLKGLCRLYLDENMLSGTIPIFLFNLSTLKSLDLSSNRFQGILPKDLGLGLHQLTELAVLYNSLTGQVPTSLFNHSTLEFLDLSDNKFYGHLPENLGVGLPQLRVVSVSYSSLTGQVPTSLFNHSTLEFLELSDDKFHGHLPKDLGLRLPQLRVVYVSYNSLTGQVPTSLFNLSTLETLDLGHNKFHGHLPTDLGLCLPQLNEFFVEFNSLTGQVPTSLSNLSKCEVLDIQSNSFTGRFYLNGNNLPHLYELGISKAFSLEGETRDLNFLDTMTNCTSLKLLSIGYSSFTGIFPQSILNLSASLHYLDLRSNQISGQIPIGLGKFVNLVGLWLGDNHFTGSVPVDIGRLKNMVSFYISNNSISGEIPSSFGNLTLLSWLYMAQNNLEGLLPGSLRNCKNLQILSLEDNRLSGVLPVELFGISSLITLVIFQNNFHGSLPMEISRLKNLGWLDVSANRFSGEIPSTLGVCTTLTFLNMSGNFFVGSIPEPLSPLKSIKTLDLSYNNLSGQIPSYFSTWPYLTSLNFSFNTLEGEVPINGVFANPAAVSVVGNSKLCGGVLELHLPKCPSPKESRRRRLPLKMIVAISVVLIIVITLVVVALCYYFLCSPRKKKEASSGLQGIKPFLKVSYQMLSRATNGFSSSNLLGVGGFGSVYKGILHQGGTELVVAVKVMNLQNERSRKSINAECKVLRNIRHKNLVRVITSCSSLDAQLNDFKALVYEFMPRGSLESWLHSNFVTNEHVGDDQSCALSLFQRLSIAIDVASALEYLHTGCETPIIHCDLKPSNILLDDEMTAHVGDFGLAKLLLGSTRNQSSSTQVRGTVGYTAPEYGIGGNVSPEGDMYSFGIVVLEMMTSKKPTDAMFSEGLNLHDFAQSALPGRLMEIIDQSMLGDAIVLPARSGADIRKIECIKSLIMVGVQCSLELPRERMSIHDAVNELKSANQNFLYTRA